MKQLIIILIFSSVLISQEFQIARVQYSGGGDWYSDPSSLPNLLHFLRTNTPMVNASEEVRIKLTDSNAKQYPYLYLTGHGNIRFTENEVIELRSILNNGGFLHADDNYGMDKSFRREIKKVYPNKDFIELPHTIQFFSLFMNLVMACLKFMNMIINHHKRWPFLKINESSYCIHMNQTWGMDGKILQYITIAGKKESLHLKWV